MHSNTFTLLAEEESIVFAAVVETLLGNAFEL